MDCSTPGLPVHHQLPEFIQIHVHWVGDAIQPSYPLSSPSPTSFNLSQHQGLFKWVSSPHQVAKVLGFPGSSDGKESDCNAGDLGSIPGLRRCPLRREGWSTPVFLPGDSRGQRSLTGYGPRGRKESNPTERLALLPFSSVQFSSIQLLSRVWLFVTPWTAARRASLSITNTWSLLKLMSIELVMSCNHLILLFPLLFPHSIFPSLRVFSNKSVLCIRWPSIGGSASSVLPMDIQDWFPLKLTGLISLQSKGLSRVFSSTTVQKH